MRSYKRTGQIILYDNLLNNHLVIIQPTRICNLRSLFLGFLNKCLEIVLRIFFQSKSRNQRERKCVIDTLSCDIRIPHAICRDVTKYTKDNQGWKRKLLHRPRCNHTSIGYVEVTGSMAFLLLNPATVDRLYKDMYTLRCPKKIELLEKFMGDP